MYVTFGSTVEPFTANNFPIAISSPKRKRDQQPLADKKPIGDPSERRATCARPGARMRPSSYLGTDTSLFSLLCEVLPGYISEVFYYFHFLNVVLMSAPRSLSPSSRACMCGGRQYWLSSWRQCFVFDSRMGH